MVTVSGLQLLPQGTAYGLLIGLGVLFCGIILVAIKVQRTYLSEDSGTSEMFMVANRSVGTGLTASAVFSSWMWINETVFAAAMCYRFGLAVPLVSPCLPEGFVAVNPNLVLMHVFTVVGIGPLLPDRVDGGTRCIGQNSSSVCAHVSGNHTNALRQGMILM
jgi:hypothetical protein